MPLSIRLNKKLNLII